MAKQISFMERVQVPQTVIRPVEVDAGTRAALQERLEALEQKMPLRGGRFMIKRCQEWREEFTVLMSDSLKAIGLQGAKLGSGRGGDPILKALGTDKAALNVRFHGSVRAGVYGRIVDEAMSVIAQYDAPMQAYVKALFRLPVQAERTWEARMRTLIEPQRMAEYDACMQVLGDIETRIAEAPHQDAAVVRVRSGMAR